MYMFVFLREYCLCVVIEKKINLCEEVRLEPGVSVTYIHA